MSPSARKASEPHYRALIEILRTAETLWNSSRIFFARWHLSPSQFNLLNLLSQPPYAANQVDLSRQLLMHRSNITGLVDRLEKRGLLRRTAQPQDRRAYRVILTPNGEALLKEILPHYHQAAVEVWGNTSQKAVQSILKSMQHLALNAEKVAASKQSKVL